MRDINLLPHDLKRWMERSEEDAKETIAEEALADAKDYAPKATGFLASHGYAFVDGNLYDETTGVEEAPERVEIRPEGNYNHDVTIVFRAGKSREDAPPFDYAYYVGVVNPDWLRLAVTMHWIQSALSPDNPHIFKEIGEAVAFNWSRLQR